MKQVLKSLESELRKIAKQKVPTRMTLLKKLNDILKVFIDSVIERYQEPETTVAPETEVGIAAPEIGVEAPESEEEPGGTEEVQTAPEFLGDFQDDEALGQYALDNGSKVFNMSGQSFQIGQEVETTGDPETGIKGGRGIVIAPVSENSMIVLDEDGTMSELTRDELAMPEIPETVEAPEETLDEL